MTIYVSKATSLTPIWVEHFWDLSKQRLGLVGIQEMCRQFVVFTQTLILQRRTHTMELMQRAAECYLSMHEHCVLHINCMAVLFQTLRGPDGVRHTVIAMHTVIWYTRLFGWI